MARVVPMEQIGADSEGERADAEQLDGDDEGDAEQDQPPGELAAEDAVDDGGHEAGLRGGGLLAADALNPLDFDLVRWRASRGIYRRRASVEPMALRMMYWRVLVSSEWVAEGLEVSVREMRSRVKLPSFWTPSGSWSSEMSMGCGCAGRSGGPCSSR